MEGTTEDKRKTKKRERNCMHGIWCSSSSSFFFFTLTFMAKSRWSSPFHNPTTNYYFRIRNYGGSKTKAQNSTANQSHSRSPRSSASQNPPPAPQPPPSPLPGQPFSPSLLPCSAAAARSRHPLVASSWRSRAGWRPTRALLRRAGRRRDKS